MKVPPLSVMASWICLKAIKRNHKCSNRIWIFAKICRNNIATHEAQLSSPAPPTLTGFPKHLMHPRFAAVSPPAGNGQILGCIRDLLPAGNLAGYCILVDTAALGHFFRDSCSGSKLRLVTICQKAVIRRPPIISTAASQSCSQRLPFFHRCFRRLRRIIPVSKLLFINESYLINPPVVLLRLDMQRPCTVGAEIRSYQTSYQRSKAGAAAVNLTASRIVISAKSRGGCPDLV